MFKKYLYGIPFFALALAVLLISVLRSASVSYVFASSTQANLPILGTKTIDVVYQFPYPGSILPDSPFWSLKAMRDKVWYFLSGTHLKKAELALLFSDKRLMASKILFENKKPDIALSTLSKGEKYLEIATYEEDIARKSGFDTSSFLIKLVTASLKHRQIIEEEILPIAPEDGKPEIIKIENYSKNVYKTSRDALNSSGIEPPRNPFDSP